MRIAKYQTHLGHEGLARLLDDSLAPLNLSQGQYSSLTDILESDDPLQVTEFLTDQSKRIPLAEVRLLAPIDRQEVWAAGVTYKRSRTARMEESAAAADCYDRVYASPRPELFFKATPHRVSGPGEPLRIRQDAKWNVPEPELTLVLNSRLDLVGFTIGNDMSSRDIEGENPLYLPQAKLYDQSCGLGPCIKLASGMHAPHGAEIALTVRRGGATAFTGKTNVSQMARSFADLIHWLGRDNSFPHGVFLLTGTGIVPDASFTLAPGDVVEIAIEDIGTLSNPVVQAAS